MNITGKLMLTTAMVAAFSTGGAMAADLSVPMAQPAPVVATPTNWDGPYIGASVGYGWGTADASDTGGDVATASPTGWLVGAQLGYNFHVADQIVLGVEGNIDWVGETGSYDNGFSASSIQTNWEGSIRGRVGYDIDNILPYLEAGVAFANVNDDWTGTNSTRTGWTVGAGIEFMLADQLSANVEYRYSDYGTFSDSSANNSVHLTDSTVRVGLNYHF